MLGSMLRLIVTSESGQDLIEYALMAGFVAVAAGAFLPSIAPGVSTVFSRVGSAVTAAGS